MERVQEERGPRKSGSSSRPTGSSIQGGNKKVVSICLAKSGLILFFSIHQKLPFFQLPTVPSPPSLFPLCTLPSPSSPHLYFCHLLLHSAVAVCHFLTVKNRPFLKIATKYPPPASHCPGRSLITLLASVLAITIFSSTLPWQGLQVTFCHLLSNMNVQRQRQIQRQSHHHPLHSPLARVAGRLSRISLFILSHHTPYIHHTHTPYPIHTPYSYSTHKSNILKFSGPKSLA